MQKPTVAKRQPVEIMLEAGKTYKWCQCGLSKNQPFCDDSHMGTPFSPKVFEVIHARKVWLCMCKQTNLIPYCDGSHLKIRQ